MGGCRCSYRTCKAKSDGQIHMFHFPVFDKLRCHQWITNSHKPHFLNLKLSQLKNRVICQDHFTDDNFMNFKRDKLKPSAIPTEDGPNCVSCQPQVKMVDDDKPVIVINPDDIENETLNSVDKKAHSSIKYGDFLISDVTELFNSSHNNFKNQTLSQKVQSKKRSERQDHEETPNYTIIYPSDEQTKTGDPEKASTSHPIAIEYCEDISLPVKLTTEIQQAPTFNSTEYQSNSIRNATTLKKVHKDKMVKILSEKKISEPVLVEGELKPISPSMIIRRPARKFKDGMLDVHNLQRPTVPQPMKDEESFEPTNNNVISQEEIIVYGQTVPIEYTPKELDNVINYQLINENISGEVPSSINTNSVENQKNIDNTEFIDKDKIAIEEVFLNCMLKTAEKLTVPKKKPASTPALKSLLKNKITPEKLAAIEQKRRFNLKLRDVITSCLDNMDNENAVIEKNINQEKKRTVKRILSSKAPASSNPPGNMIAYLETRLQRMEDTLLNKIDHNTQRINELKRTIKPSSNSRHANTQTYLNHMNEESQKLYLYKEISKFLTPNLNISIYEELFMEKTTHSVFETASPRKLRKRR